MAVDDVLIGGCGGRICGVRSSRTIGSNFSDRGGSGTTCIANALGKLFYSTDGGSHFPV